MLATLASIFGGLVLLLAVLHLYGVMTYTIVRRTAEFGLRMALGARPGDGLSLVLRESLRLVALGIALGIPAAIAAGGLLRSLLFGVTPADPLTLATVHTQPHRLRHSRRLPPPTAPREWRRWRL